MKEVKSFGRGTNKKRKHTQLVIFNVRHTLPIKIIQTYLGDLSHNSHKPCKYISEICYSTVDCMRCNVFLEKLFQA